MVDQISDRATKAVQAPDHESFAGTDLVQELAELGPSLASTRGRVSEDPIEPNFSQCTKLEFRVFVAGGDSGISEEIPHVSKCINTHEVLTFSQHNL